MPQGNGTMNPGVYSLEHVPTSAVIRSNNIAKGGRNSTGEIMGKVYDDVDTSDDGIGNEDEDGTTSVSGTDATDFGSLTSVE